MQFLNVKGINVALCIDGPDFIEDREESYEILHKPIPPMNGFTEGNIPWNKGVAHSEETKKKISEKHTGRPSHWRGKKQPKAAVEKMKQNLPDRKGAANARAREYEITFEDGRQIIIKSLETWARENGYVPMSLRNLYNGSGRTKHKDIVSLRQINI